MAIVLGAAWSAHATNHLIRINEIMAGYNGDSSIQFIEFVVNDQSQKAWGPLSAVGSGPNRLGRAQIEFFDGAGTKTGRFVFPSNPGGAGMTVLVATQEFATLTGITPDFILPKGMLQPNAGRIVYGRNPSSGGAFHVELTVSYGGAAFTMPNDAGGAANAATLSLIGGMSLSRTTNFGFGDGPGGTNNNTNFALRAPTPCSTATVNTLNNRNNVTGQAGLPAVATQVKAGENLFLKETFRGNGRTCATCHSPQHQFGMPPSFVATLPVTDPLFVHELNVNTITVNDNGSMLDPAGTNVMAETNRTHPSDFVLGGTLSDGLGHSAKVIAGTGGTYWILGGQDLVVGALLTDGKNNKGLLVSFTAGNLGGPTPANGLSEGLEVSSLLRGTGAPSGIARALVLENINGIAQPHVFRGSPTLVSVKHTAPYGLSGEFGNLRDFSAGAVAQHFPLSMNRIAGVDFRNATAEELLALEAFQNSILTPADENFDELNQFSRFATTEKQKRGRDLFFGTAKCSACHGGKALSSSDGQFGTQLGVNENFNTGVAAQDINILDGLPSEHDIGQPVNSRKFNVPTLFNIRKTAPYFHDNSANTLVQAVEFYDSIPFNASPAKGQVGPIVPASDPVSVFDIVAFLESLVDLPFDYTREIAFPLTHLGQSSAQTVTLVNTGTAQLMVSNLALRGEHPDEFGHMLFTPDDGPIGPGEQRTIQILFSPANSGVRTAIFEFDVSDGAETYEVGVVLSGEGSLLPVIVGTQADQPVDDTATILPFSTVEIGNASPTEVLTVMIDFISGTGELSGGGFSADGPGLVSFQGTAEECTVAIQALVYAPFANTFEVGGVHEEGFNITVSNGVVQAFDNSTTVLIASVNDAPVIDAVVAGQQITDNAQVKPFQSIQILDNDRPDQHLVVTITLDMPSIGTLDAAEIMPVSPGVYAFHGTASEVSQALSNTDFVPANNIRAPGEQHMVTFQLDVDDGFSVVTDSTTTVTVTSQNDLPVLAGAHASSQISDLENFLPFGVASVSDVDSPAQRIDARVELDNENKGAMFGAFTNFGGGIYGFSGSPAEVSLALRTLVFKPTQNRVQPGQSEDTTFTVRLSDSVGEAVFDGVSVITVFSSNDQPLFSGVSASQTTNDRVPFKLFAGVQVVDADAFGLPITVTVTQDGVERGLLQGGGFAETDGTPMQRILRYTGSLAQVNSALTTLAYVPVSDRVPVGESEDSVFTLAVSDGSLGFTTGQLTVKVVSVNDAPSFTKGPHQIALEDSAQKTVPNWATMIVPGPGSETGQTVWFELVSENPALFSVQPAVSPDGTLTFTPAPDASGTVLVTVQIKDNGGTAFGGLDTSPAQVFSITLIPVNELPQAAIGGDSLAGVAGVPVFFTAAPSRDPDGTLVQYLWDFGDGSPVVTGFVPSHRFGAAGTYTVTLTVTDNEGATSTATQQIVIVAGDGGGPLGDADGDGLANQDDSDADGDGYSNDIETLAGTNAFDSGSTPFGGGVVPPDPLTVSKLLIGLNFTADGKDSIQLGGTLALPDKAVLNGAKVLLNVGGVVRTFRLNAKGQGKDAANSFALLVKAKNGVITAKFSAKLAKGTFHEQLKDEKFTAESANGATRTVLVALVFDTLGKHYQQVLDVTYTVVSGKAKGKK